MSSQSIHHIAFIGTGVMGSAMASHLLARGYALTVHNRTRERARALLEAGARWADTPAAAAAAADLAITIVGYPADVREVWLGEQGVLSTLRPGACGLDMTTSTPDLAGEIARAAADRGCLVGDAPVTGGDVGAKKGTLAVLFGGSADLYARVAEAVGAFSASFTRFGEAGAGQYAKMCNQIAIAAGMMAVCEAIIAARRCGLDPNLLVETIGKGAAASFSLSSYGPRILRDDFNPGFFIKHFIKDLRIARDTALKLGLELPGMKQALALYEELSGDGLDDRGTQALYLWYEKHARAQ